MKYFKNCLYKISKIPITRFDQESGETWFGADATSVARTEINFGRYVTRLRNQFAQIMIKPLQLQLALDFPELQENRAFLDTITLQYKSYNLFEELMELDLMGKRIQSIQEMKDGLVDMSPDGSEIKFFSSQFLVKKYLKLSDADLELNAKLKKEDMEEFKKFTAEEGEGMEGLESEPANVVENEPDNIEKDSIDDSVQKRRQLKRRQLKRKGNRRRIKKKGTHMSSFLFRILWSKLIKLKSIRHKEVVHCFVILYPLLNHFHFIIRLFVKFRIIDSHSSR